MRRYRAHHDVIVKNSHPFGTLQNADNRVQVLTVRYCVVQLQWKNIHLNYEMHCVSRCVACSGYSAT